MTWGLVSLKGDAGPRPAVEKDGVAYPLNTLLGRSFRDMQEVLDDWDAVARVIPDALSGAKATDGMALSSVTLTAPLVPSTLFIAGANYSDHAAEMARSGGPALSLEVPWHVLKATRACVVGPGAQVALPADAEKVDWEVELAVVIGREARNVAASDALGHVAGYTVANDLSARDLSRRADAPDGSPFRMDWIAHKSFDGACPLGPRIVPEAFVADPQALRLRLSVNGETMQEAGTDRMIFSVAQQIASLSARLTLFPGDVILTGTPSGSGAGRGRFLKPGDRVLAEIDGIGPLETNIV